MSHGVVLHEEDLPALDVLGETFQRDRHSAIVAPRTSSRFAFSRRDIEVLARARAEDQEALHILSREFASIDIAGRPRWPPRQAGATDQGRCPS